MAGPVRDQDLALGEHVLVDGRRPLRDIVTPIPHAPAADQGVDGAEGALHPLADALRRRIRPPRRMTRCSAVRSSRRAARRSRRRNRGRAFRDCPRRAQRRRFLGEEFRDHLPSRLLERSVAGVSATQHRDREPFFLPSFDERNPHTHSVGSMIATGPSRPEAPRQDAGGGRLPDPSGPGCRSSPSPR